MDPEIFEEVFISAFDHAKELLQSEVGLMPTAFLFTPAEEPGQFVAQIFPMPFTSDIHKEFYKQMFREVAKKVKPVAVMFVSEAWIATCASQEEYEEFEGPVRNRPDRREAVILHGRTALFNRLRTQEFTKEGDKYVFGKVMDLHDSSELCGFTDGIFPPVSRTKH